MKAIIDREGRISLEHSVQEQLGVKPGDEVILESRGEELIVKAVKSAGGLCQEGNVLVHRGVTTVNGDELAATRNERFEQLTKGLPK